MYLYEIDNLDIAEVKRKGIKKACEKQISKAIQFDTNDLNICPVCKEHVETDDKYCRNCGQRIILDLNNK
jgi:predicted amidophosphoribosyltransferase